MAKYCGEIGYAIVSETTPGVWEENTVARVYYGDIYKNRVNMQQGSEVNTGVTLNQQISILADPCAFENFLYMRYATYMNKKWTITSVEVEYPRLILSIGGIYNGQ